MGGAALAGQYRCSALGEHDSADAGADPRRSRAVGGDVAGGRSAFDARVRARPVLCCASGLREGRPDDRVARRAAPVAQHRRRSRCVASRAVGWLALQYSAPPSSKASIAWLTPNSSPAPGRGRHSVRTALPETSHATPSHTGRCGRVDPQTPRRAHQERVGCWCGHDPPAPPTPPQACRVEGDDVPHHPSRPAPTQPQTVRPLTPVSA